MLYAIENSPYGRAQDDKGNRIGNIYAFESKEDRRRWMEEDPTDYPSQPGSREELPSRHPAVYRALHFAHKENGVIYSHDCEMCRESFEWKSDLRQHKEKC